MAHKHIHDASKAQALNMLNQLKQWRASADPLLTQTLLACGEDHYYETHEAPQLALLALSELFASHSEATHAARQAGAKVDAFAYMDPKHMSALFSTLARSMTGSTCRVEYANTIRTLHQQVAEE